MAIKVKRKSNQSSDQLQVAFNRQTTRFVKELRNSRYLDEKVSPLKKKRAAIIREKHRKINTKKKFYE